MGEVVGYTGTMLLLLLLAAGYGSDSSATTGLTRASLLAMFSDDAGAGASREDVLDSVTGVLGAGTSISLGE